MPQFSKHHLNHGSQLAYFIVKQIDKNISNNTPTPITITTITTTNDNKTGSICDRKS